MSKYIAKYSRYHVPSENEYDTAKEAALFLLNGERNGELSWEKIISPEGVVVADAEREENAYEELEELAGEDF